MHRDETILAVGIGEAARRLGLSARTVASLVLRQELPSRKVGRRRIIPVVALEAFISRDRNRSTSDQDIARHSSGNFEEGRP
jgi:excisionase family DNA binding protein